MTNFIEKVINGWGFNVMPADNFSVVRCYCERIAHRYPDPDNFEAEARELNLVPVPYENLGVYHYHNPAKEEYAIACMSVLSRLPANTVLLFDGSKLENEEEWLFIANRNAYGSPVDENHLYYTKDIVINPETQIYAICYK